MMDKINRMHQKMLDTLIETLKKNKPHDLTWNEFGLKIDYPFARSKMCQWEKGFSLECGTYERLMNLFVPKDIPNLKKESLAIITKLRRSWEYKEIALLTGIHNPKQCMLRHSRNKKSNMTLITYCKIKAVEE